MCYHCWGYWIAWMIGPQNHQNNTHTGLSNNHEKETQVKVYILVVSMWLMSAWSAESEWNGANNSNNNKQKVHVNYCSLLLSLFLSLQSFVHEGCHLKISKEKQYLKTISLCVIISLMCNKAQREPHLWTYYKFAGCTFRLCILPDSDHQNTIFF